MLVSRSAESSKITPIAHETAPAPDLPTYEFALIPGGPFAMGDALGRGEFDELPVHTVNVSAFYMGKTEVTKAQWDEVYNWAVDNGYGFDNEGHGKAINHPVHSIYWYDMVKWCNAKSEKEGLAPCYRVDGAVYKTGGGGDVVCDWEANGYRLPTEAEWEKAARGGLGGKRFPWGDTISHKEANFKNEGGESYATGTTGLHPDYAKGEKPYTSPVGSFAPNGYGLYDMAGNAFEWCWDRYQDDYYASSPTTDPRGPATGSVRVLRGGTWDFFAWHARVSDRHGSRPGDRFINDGFRLARGRL